MDEQEYEQTLAEEIAIEQEDDSAESEEDRLLQSMGMNEAYGTSEAEERQNQHSFLHKAAFGTSDTMKTTYLSEWELGRPLFSVRFLADLNKISRYYLDDLITQLGKNSYTENRIANYFWEKIQNITSSGMSNQGFAMRLNVTKKIDTMRKRVRENNIDNLKGGKPNG